jgi:hypothetical protein
MSYTTMSSVNAPNASGLEALHETRRNETAQVLEALLGIRNRALFELQKTGSLFMYLSPAQQDIINRQFEPGSFLLEEIVRRSALPLVEKPGRGRVTVQLPALAGSRRPNSLKRIATVKKNILQFGVIRSRAAELAGALAGSVTAFNHQYKTARRELFPLGILSRLWRNIRRFFSRPYFTRRDLGYLRNLGAAAGFVLKMAEAPI